MTVADAAIMTANIQMYIAAEAPVAAPADVHANAATIVTITLPNVKAVLPAIVDVDVDVMTDSN